ncbi:hypothetical protein CLOM_g13297 [Closterium sp. NIES-68]|nr:hypothetical protein CLOM_g13297 [Closterium sp. NIES-68]
MARFTAVSAAVLVLCLLSASISPCVEGRRNADALEEWNVMAAVAINIPKTLPKAATLGIFSFVKALLAARKTGAATLFVPLNAFLLTKDLLKYGADKFDRIMKYHLIQKNEYRIEDLKAMPEDTRLPTMEGSSLKIFSKKNATVVMLQGRVFLPSVVVVPNVYVGTKMAVHLISHHLIPTSFSP